MKILNKGLFLGLVVMGQTALAADPLMVVFVNNWTNQPLKILKVQNSGTEVIPGESGTLPHGQTPMVVSNRLRVSEAAITIGLDWQHYCKFTTKFDRPSFLATYYDVTVNEKKGIKTCNILRRGGPTFTLHFGTE